MHRDGEGGREGEMESERDGEGGRRSEGEGGRDGVREGGWRGMGRDGEGVRRSEGEGGRMREGVGAVHTHPRNKDASIFIPFIKRTHPCVI
jgi:hypothetical protein